MKREQGISSQPSDPMGEGDQWIGSIVKNRVAWEIISQGGTTIQTTVSPRGYVSASRDLWGEKRVTPNCRYMPRQIERHEVM
jgi:hypothetical protein